MKKLLNTLYITTQGTYLARERETVKVRMQKQTKLKIPIHTLSGIVCFGRVSVSPGLMELCGGRKVSLSFLSERGRFISRVHGRVSGNVLLRRQQYRWADNLDVSADLARSMVLAKINNQRAVLQRGARDHSGSPGATLLNSAADRLTQTISALRQPRLLDEVRGCEGDSAREYFSVFDHLIVHQKDGFRFEDRNRRPPLDPVNALLSFLYTILTHDVTSALETVGLDPAVGFLHRDRPGRMSLALDLMEELRPVLADRLVLSMINRKQVQPSGFRKTESGAVVMEDAVRKEVVVAYQKRKQEEIMHPFIEEKIPIGMVPYVQATLLARHVRGDLDGYPPFLWK